MTSFGATNFVFKITNENNSFSIIIPGHWNSEDGEEVITVLNKIFELRSENDIEFYVKQVEKKGARIEIGNSEYNLAGFNYFKSEIFSELKRVIYRDLGDMVYRLQRTYEPMTKM